MNTLLAQPFHTLPQLLAWQAQTRPGHPALVLDGEVLDHAGLWQRVQQVAGALQRDGVQPGQAVAMCAATSLAYVSTFLGAVLAGVTVAPLPPTATPAQLQALSRNAGAVAVFVDADTQAHWTGAQLPCVPLDEPAWSRWLQDAPAPQAVARQPHEPFNIIYSSGTTGLPKGIVQSCGMRWAQLQRSPANGFGPQAVTLLALPLYSNLTLTYLFGALGLGGTVVLMGKFDAGRYLALAEQHGGEYLARGGAMSLKETDLWKPQRLVIIRFPSAEQANRFYDSPEYQKVLQISKQAARRTVVVLEGL